MSRNIARFFHLSLETEFNALRFINYTIPRLCSTYAVATIDNIRPQQFWSLTDQDPDLVRHLRVQVRLMGNLGLNAGGPWLSDTYCLKCFIYKNGIRDAGHFFFGCICFKENFNMLWSDLKTTLPKRILYKATLYLASYRI